MQGIAIKSLIAGLIMVTLAAHNGRAQGGTAYVVNDAGNDCDGLPAGYTRIQEAVDAALEAGAPGTILVCPGAYTTFTVEGANKLTIRAAKPKLPIPTVGPESPEPGTIVTINHSTNVVIDRLWIDGTAFDNAPLGHVAGIRFTDSTGTIQNNVITSLMSEPITEWGRGTAMFVTDTDGADAIRTRVTIKNNDILKVSDSGIWVGGPAQVSVSNNRIAGVYAVEWMTFHGVHMTTSDAGTPTGSITRNRFDTVGKAIHLVGVSGVTMKSNIIERTYYGVVITTYCSFLAPTASGNKFSGNTVQAKYGVVITANGGDCGTHADRNIISGNKFTFYDVYGVPESNFMSVSVFSAWPGESNALYNRITNNKFRGWPEAVRLTGAPTTIVRNNRIMP